MVDDHKYSIGRTVVYRHQNPTNPPHTFGQYGPERTVGRIMGVELLPGQEHRWVYTVENIQNHERARVPESDILFAMLNRKKYRPHGEPMTNLKLEGETIAEKLQRMLTESVLANYLQTTISDLVRREESEERARRQGRDLPLLPGDYIRVRGDIRPEMEPHHNHYAKILSVEPPDIPALEAPPDRRGEVQSYAVVKQFMVQLEDGTQTKLYDPEVKLYYTADGRRTILNWRAASFLAESFGDEPPYKVEYSFLEDHVFTRDELEEMTNEQLVEMFAALLYVKGHMGLRDFERKGTVFEDIPREYLVDSILASSRFNMRKNRNMTPEEIDHKRREGYKLRRMLKGS